MGGWPVSLLQLVSHQALLVVVMVTGSHVCVRVSNILIEVAAISIVAWATAAVAISSPMCVLCWTGNDTILAKRYRSLSFK